MRIVFSLFLSCQAFGLIGGQVAKPGDFPSVVYIQDGCTASFITSEKILLAAHCVRPYKDVVLHRVDQRIRLYLTPVALEQKPLDAIISRIDIHPIWLRKIESHHDMYKFISQKGTVDLAVITLKNMSETFPKQRLTPISYDPLQISNKVFIGGYGCESFDQPSRNPRYKYASKTLFKVDGNHAYVTEVDSNQVTQSIPCEGDSGGPVYTVEGASGIKRLKLVGVNSFVHDRGSRSITGLVQISALKTWLDKVLR